MSLMAVGMRGRGVGEGIRVGGIRVRVGVAVGDGTPGGRGVLVSWRQTHGWAGGKFLQRGVRDGNRSEAESDGSSADDMGGAACGTHAATHWMRSAARIGTLDRNTLTPQAA